MASSAISIERAWWRIAVSSWRTTIRPPRGRDALVEALLHGADDLVEGQARPDVLLGGVADLGVDDAVGRQVLDALARDPGERRAGLHDGDRVVEGLEVAHQRAGVGRLGEPGAERVGVVGRQLVAGLGGQLEIVWGRRPPSRWSWSRTFGARRTSSRVGSQATIHQANHASPCASSPRSTSSTRRPAKTRYDRVGHDRSGPGRPVRRRHRDHQWIHVDVERAATGPFGATIAHGYLTLSLIP